MSQFHKELQAFSMSIEKELVERELNFPTVIGLSRRIRRVADDPHSSAEQLAVLVRVEPVVSARVVRMANSVIFSPAGESVSSVARAITRIGISNVRVIALVVAMDQLASENRPKPLRERARNLWRHAVDAGAWGYALARGLNAGSPDTALLAGLMTEVGQLYLIARVGQYPSVAVDSKGFADVCEFWSTAVTDAIIESMELPPDMQDAADPADPYAGAWPPATLRDVLHVARLIAEPDVAVDPHKRELRAARRAQMQSTMTNPTFDELLAAAAPDRESFLEVFELSAKA